MMEFVYGQDEQVTQFIATFAHGQLAAADFEHCKTIGVTDGEGNLIAGVVYFNFKPWCGTIEIGAASTTSKWFTRATYKRIFEYPFIECGCQMVRAYIRADNERLLSQFARMNFDLIMLPRHYGQADDGVLCTLTDDQWLDCRIARRLYRDVTKRKEMEAA
jgi:hypothetical protein